MTEEAYIGCSVNMLTIKFSAITYMVTPLLTIFANEFMNVIISMIIVGIAHLKAEIMVIRNIIK